MLVLSRKIGQQVRIGDNVVVTVLKSQGNTVRVGIEAPREVRVIRAELPPLDIHKNNMASEEPSCAGAAQTKCPAKLAVVRGTGSTPGTHQEGDDSRTDPRHCKRVNPHRWSVANMRERVESQPAAAHH